MMDCIQIVRDVDAWRAASLENLPAKLHGVLWFVGVGVNLTCEIRRSQLEKVGIETLFIEPGSPWENGYIESFNGKLRDELRNAEVFMDLSHAHGEVLRCDMSPAEAIPTVSDWELLVMTLLVLKAGTIVLKRRRLVKAARSLARIVIMAALLTVSLAFSPATARAQALMEWVVVGDPGNVGELRGEGAGGLGPDRVSGAVDHIFRIGKYEVTNGQYIEFLNAVAAVEDTYDLYNTTGQEGGMPGTYGGIEQTGVAGEYQYGPKNEDSEWLDRPVNFISFYDALRFANWMHNGQPNGLQDSTTTEDGAYDMSLGANVVRKAGARFFVPSEDECYKAGFYKGSGINAGYWDYQTQSDTPPVCEPPPGRDEPPGSAHYFCGDGSAVGPPYYTTAVGAYTYSPGPYGTFDQAGNMAEWGEDLIGPNRINCGLPWGAYESALSAATRIGADPDAPGGFHSGFRLAAVYEPEPIPVISGWSVVVMTLLLLTVGTVIALRVRCSAGPN